MPSGMTMFPFHLFPSTRPNKLMTYFLCRALSDQIFGSSSHHVRLRKEVCDYVESRPDRYKLFVDEDSVQGGFEGHVRSMRSTGTLRYVFMFIIPSYSSRGLDSDFVFLFAVEWCV